MDNTIFKCLDVVVYIVGSLCTIAFIIGGIISVIFWVKGVSKPLWRLGLGLSRRKVTIVASSDDCESLSNTLAKSDLFSKKNIACVTSPSDVRDLCNANLILLKLSDSSITLENILKNKKPDAALVVYAKLGEIKTTQWELLDLHRNVSVTNLRGRLMTDLLNAMMTTSYEKR